ncbi:MAG TPA: M36 family metallopeptidase [Actinomycetota bacterium]|nr:M36 family metallopeptidase [Actinomycetota bacterium]
MSRRQRSRVLALAAVFTLLALVPKESAAVGQADAVSRERAIEIALDHVRGDAAALGVGRADVARLAVASAYRSAHSGVTHVNLNQRRGALEVFGAYATVNVAADGTVLFVGDSLVRGLRAAGLGVAQLGAREAVAAAASGLRLDRPADLRVLASRGGPARRTVVSGGGISDRPIPARLGWQATDNGLRLGWQLVIDDSASDHVWNATVDARTGRLLDLQDWTSHADPVTTPDPVEDGSTYRVFGLPKESPNDGGRDLITNPADAVASPFGWHDVNGIAGAEFTRTQGNNTHAYTDHNADGVPDPLSDPDGGLGLTFDFPLDLTKDPHEYSDAAVTNLFFWCNTAHDLFYRYGFDEASGNFQVNNYGRGGVGGDDVRCEAQDGGGLNNANFFTPAVDGGRPRMQMFLWDVGLGPRNLVTIDPPSSAAGIYGATGASFGPAPTESGVSGDVVLVNDGVAAPSTTDACEPLVGFPPGSVALLDRGTCNFVVKVKNAQDAGATAVIVANNVAGNPITMGGSDPTIVIPSVMVSLANGDTIKAGLPATGTVSSNPDRGVMRDGDLESGIVFHEYGHGLSNRLTGGPTVNCLTGQEQMGEGWSDYVAIAALIDPALDDPEGPRGMGTYVLWQDNRQGAGIRPRPYSRNMEIQPATYDSIKTGGWLEGATLSQPHGIGHVWAAVLLDMTWDLIDRHGFNPNIYESWDTGGNNLAYQLVIDGLKFQGCGPGFVVGRDAILAADAALTGGENACTVWAAFARRGLGFGAQQGTSASRDDNAEAFDTHPDCRRGFQSPVHQPYGTLNDMVAGDVKPMRFTADGLTGRDILASNSPYSRQVECATLATRDPNSSFITPRPLPVPAETPGNSGLTVNSRGVYTYQWETAEEWGGTCREFVLTRTDGVQHRAFFRFLEG